MRVECSAATSALCWNTSSTKTISFRWIRMTQSSGRYWQVSYRHVVRSRSHEVSMTTTTTIQLFVFLLAAFVGFQTISRIPPFLHTPLMAATNAISRISLVASLLLAGSHQGHLANPLG